MSSNTRVRVDALSTHSRLRRGSAGIRVPSSGSRRSERPTCVRSGDPDKSSRSIVGGSATNSSRRRLSDGIENFPFFVRRFA